MRFVTIIKHIGIVLASVVVLLGIPLWSTGWLHSLFSADPDAVSSASVILDKPSGNYLVLINRNLHPDPDKLKDWITFFSGGNILYIFEDISCSVAASDPGGVELAESYRSQLPEHQMKVIPEDGTLLLSRADAGLFDILVMSQEFADAHQAESAFRDSIVVIEVKQEPVDPALETKPDAAEHQDDEVKTGITVETKAVDQVTAVKSGAAADQKTEGSKKERL